jgi:hypothetical protein
MIKNHFGECFVHHKLQVRSEADSGVDSAQLKINFLRKSQLI